MYQQILDLASSITKKHSPKVILASDFPGISDGLSMLENVKIGQGKNYLEINLTTLEAQPAFDWLAEITLSTDDTYRHFLLMKDGRIVETYGKQVIYVSQSDASWLYTELERAAD